MSERDDGQEMSMVQAVPGMVRLSAAMWWKAASWSVTQYLRATSRVMRAAANGESVSELMADAAGELRERLRQLLDIVDTPQEETRQRPRSDAGDGGRDQADDDGGRDDSPKALRERGAALLRDSAEVEDTNSVHPAFAHVLENLAPDEGRILRLLATEGPQPSVDIRSNPPIGSGDMIASGLNMIGPAAGCLHNDRVHAYLANLHRLGLIWFSNEPLDDQGEYQVLEAQPEVQVAMSESGRTQAERRSIHMTAFGKEFCETCLPLDTAEIDLLPRSKNPRRGEQPNPPRA